MVPACQKSFGTFRSKLSVCAGAGAGTTQSLASHLGASMKAGFLYSSWTVHTLHTTVTTTYTLDSRTLQHSASWKPQTIASSLHPVADSQQPATSTVQPAAEQPTVSRSSQSAELALLVPSLRCVYTTYCVGGARVGTTSKQSLVQTFAEGGEVSLFRGAYVC